jgi:adenylate cyclase
MSFGRLAVLLSLAVLGVYFFVTAPAPLPEHGAAKAERSVPIGEVFDTIDAINAGARKLYTAKVVGEGKKAGLKFEEDWYKDGVEAGPLPALFMRMVAEKLQKKTPQVGLFLGSDKPINPSNLFKGEQAARFESIRADGKPQKFAMPDGFQVAMYADIASAKPCVTCHNEHKDTPKKDWKLDDVMGASTWTFERAMVTPDEYRRIVAVVYEAVGEAYSDYLAKAKTFADPPLIGTDWPAEGQRAVPDAATLMSAVYVETGGRSLRDLLTLGEERAASAPDAAPAPVHEEPVSADNGPATGAIEAGAVE